MGVSWIFRKSEVEDESSDIAESFEVLKRFQVSIDSFVTSLDELDIEVKQPNCATLVFERDDDCVAFHAVQDSNGKKKIVIEGNHAKIFSTNVTTSMHQFFGSIAITKSSGSILLGDFAIDPVNIKVGDVSVLGLRVSSIADDLAPRRFW